MRINIYVNKHFFLTGIKMDEIEIKELTPPEYKEWDLLVEETQHSTPFHTSGWLNIYRDVLSRDLRIYGCFRNSEFVEGCPVFVKKFKGAMKIGSSTPNMTDYCGPLIKESSSSKWRNKVKENYDVLSSLREVFCRQG
jgi:hypothetical protein